jgi:nucleotide-binding universal stress UspA family protein
MNKKILVSTDRTEFSEGAIQAAINMTKSCNGQLYAMSVIEINPEFMALAPQLLEDTEKEAKKHLEGIKDRLTKENVECEIILREGDVPHQFIIEEADKNEADLIVMGRRGKASVLRFILGNVTSRVIGLTSKKVLVVPRAATIKWQNIVVATDGSKQSEAAAQEALNLAKDLGKPATLHAVAVLRRNPSEERIKISENALQDIQSSAEKENVKAETLLIKDTPHELIHESILKYAKEKDADVIVMGSFGRTGLKKLLMGSVVERVLCHSECAVLVVK